MNAQMNLEKCVPFVSSHMQSPRHSSPGCRPSTIRRAVTISRECGSGARFVAKELAAYLQARVPVEAEPWRVVGRELVDEVVAEHHLPQRVTKFMPEDRVPEVTDLIDELLGLRPSTWTLVQQTSETILRLAERGNVILIGRGSHLITRHLKHVLHVRIVGSPARRCQRMQEWGGLSAKAAMQVIHREDRGQRRYLKKHYGKDPDEVVLYDLVLNTDIGSYQTAARMIGDALLGRERGTGEDAGFSARSGRPGEVEAPRESGQSFAL
jgi:hypothetical protein